MASAPIPVETLLAHREWVRAVAVAVVRDPNAADDVEQETWLAALSTPPRHATSLRGWFGAIARNRARRAGRTESRRGRRESVAARPEATPSTADLAEIADTHRRVVQAVVELDEPYRGTILLRYFEGLAVEDVAARTSVPLDTARSRISRGLAKLRERLTREFGDESSLRGALVLLVGRPNPAAPDVVRARGRVVPRATWIAAAGLVAVVGAVVVAAKRGARVEPPRTVASAPAPERPRDVPSAPTPAAAKIEDVSAPTPPPIAVSPEAPVPPAPPPVPAAASPAVLDRLGAVRVKLDWRAMPLLEGLGEIAAKAGVDVVVAAEVLELLRGADATIDQLSLSDVTAKTALTLITQLKGLSYVVEDARVVIVTQGARRDPSRQVVVPPTWDPDAPRTLTIRGVVVDENGSPTAGARVFGVHGSERTRLAETDDRGAFVVAVARPFPGVVAEIRGHAPSLPAEIVGKCGDTVDVRLAIRSLAVVVEGHVVDVDGREVAGVKVTIAGADDPPTRGAPKASEWITDERGQFRATGVAPGRLTVRASRDFKAPDGRAMIGVPITAGALVIDARPAETVHAELTLGANGPRAWRGTLRDKSGAPIAGAKVWAGGCVETTSGADGAFVVSGLAPGRNDVLVSLPSGRLARRSIHVDPDFDLEWDPAIGSAWRIAGRVTGKPHVASTGGQTGHWLWILPVTPWANGLLVPRTTLTKENGSFTFDDIEPGAYRVGVFWPSADNSLWLAGSELIDAPREDVVIAVAADQRPTAHVSGRLLRSDGRPYEDAHLVVEGGATGWVRADSTGQFRTHVIPPNRYRVYVTDWFAGQVLDLGGRDIGAADVALGTLTFPTQGRAVLSWTPVGVATGEQPKCSILRVLGDGFRVGVVRDPPVDPTAPATLTLSPGAYVVRVKGGGVQGTERTFRVESGADVAVDVPLRAAPKRRIRPNFPLGRPRVAWIRITDDAGGFVHEALLVGPEFMAPLAPGRYRVDAVVTETITLHGAFDVPADGAAERFDVVLR